MKKSMSTRCAGKAMATLMIRGNRYQSACLHRHCFRLPSAASPPRNYATLLTPQWRTVASDHPSMRSWRLAGKASKVSLPRWRSNVGSIERSKTRRVIGEKPSTAGSLQTLLITNRRAGGGDSGVYRPHGIKKGQPSVGGRWSKWTRQWRSVATSVITFDQVLRLVLTQRTAAGRIVNRSTQTDRDTGEQVRHYKIVRRRRCGRTARNSTRNHTEPF